MEPQKYYQKQARAYRLKRRLHNIKVACSDSRRREPATARGTSSPISLLPAEVLLDILDYLPPSSAACLALTCKVWCNSVRHALLSPKLRHLPDAFPGTFLSLRNKLLNNERWALIRLLQDDRWLACSACFTLHPFTNFRPNQIFFEKDSSRICHLGRETGFVDPCPCSNMSFQDKLRLVELLEQSGTAHPIFKPDGNNQLWHRCSQEYENITILTSMTPRLGKYGELILWIEYVCTWTGGIPTLHIQKEMVPRRICPHVPLMGGLYNYLHMRRPFSSTLTHVADWLCGFCKTTWSTSTSCLKGQITWRCEITRDLGNARDFPDDMWAAQNALSQDFFSEDAMEHEEYVYLGPSLSFWGALFTSSTAAPWTSPVHAH